MFPKRRDGCPRYSGEGGRTGSAWRRRVHHLVLILQGLVPWAYLAAQMVGILAHR